MRLKVRPLTPQQLRVVVATIVVMFVAAVAFVVIGIAIDKIAVTIIGCFCAVAGLVHVEILRRSPRASDP